MTHNNSRAAFLAAAQTAAENETTDRSDPIIDCILNVGQTAAHGTELTPGRIDSLTNAYIEKASDPATIARLERTAIVLKECLKNIGAPALENA